MKILHLVIFSIIIMLTSCVKDKAMKSISPSLFNSSKDNKPIELYTLKNANGIICQLTNYGARAISIYTPDKHGNFEDITIGYSTGEEYLNEEEIYFGTTVGRYGNRIANGRFTLDRVTYQLEKNNGVNSLHGGSNGFHSVVWEVVELKHNSIVFGYTSKAMEGGFPGTVSVEVKYHLTDANELTIEYVATTDKKTILNLTNHTYFNLTGNGNNSIENHVLNLNANHYTPVDDELIPTGEIATVNNTPFDFRTPKSIAQDINANHEQLNRAGGYDHNFVLSKTKNDFAAKVIEPISGRTLEVFTNEPGIQFYSGNFLNNIKGKNGAIYKKRNAFCLETQHFPDSPNQPSFPPVELAVGEQYYSYCTYKFGVE